MLAIPHGSDDVAPVMSSLPLGRVSVCNDSHGIHIAAFTAIQAEEEYADSIINYSIHSISTPLSHCGVFNTPHIPTSLLVEPPCLPSPHRLTFKV